VSSRRRFLIAWTAAAAIGFVLQAPAECGQANPAPTPPGASPTTLKPAAPDADPLKKARETVTVKNAAVDLSVPESPAFTTLGLSPETIVRPATPREFATSLLNGVDQNGHLQTGVAIDTAPYLVFAGSGVTLADYRASRVTQILSRTMVSFATTKGATAEDKSVKLALGVHATLYDSEDPRLNSDALLACFSEIPPFRTDALPIAEDPEERAKQDADLELKRLAFERDTLRPRVGACREQFQRKARWNGTSWIAAIAASGVSPTGLASDVDGGAVGVWTSVAYGFDGVPGLRDKAQLIAHVRHMSNEIVVDEELAGGQETRDTTIAGARLRAGTNSFGLSFEASYLRTAAAGRPDDTVARLAFAAERRLSPDLWLTVAFGGDRGADIGSSRGLSVLSALKWGFAKDPTLTPDQLTKLAAK